jgi:DNA-binding transcriptional LysR family regulator
MGAAVLSTRTVQNELASGKLRSLSIDGLDLSREIYATWDKRRVLPIPARLFLDLLSEPGAVTPRGQP